MRKTIIFACCLCFLAVSAQQQPAQKQRGEAVYKKYCLSCHQANGTGVPNLNPPLINTNYVKGDKTKLITWVLKGSAEEGIEIDGETYSNKMPAQNYLSDQQIADVLSYVRSSFGNKASAITPAEVKTVRASVK